jgi:hypothetical protein
MSREVEQIVCTRSFIIVLINCEGEEIDVYDLCVSFGAYVGEEKCMLYFCKEIMRNAITRKTRYILENNIKMKMKWLEGFGLDSSG